MNQRSVGRHRRFGGRHRGQRLIVDIHQPGYVLGNVAVALDNYQRDRFAHEPDLVGGQDWLIERLGRLLGVDAGQRGQPDREIVGREDAHHSGVSGCCARIDPPNQRMGVGAAHEHGMDHAVQLDVGQIPAIPL